MRHSVAFSLAIAAFFGLVGLSGPLAAAPAIDAQAGKRLYMRCVACHSLNASAPAKTGPHLQGIIGRKSASVSNFPYSPGMRSANVIWTEATMDKWLAKPRSVVPGTTMIFVGMSDPAQRKALIAFLKKPTP